MESAWASVRRARPETEGVCAHEQTAISRGARGPSPLVYLDSPRPRRSRARGGACRPALNSWERTTIRQSPPGFLHFDEHDRPPSDVPRRFSAPQYEILRTHRTLGTPTGSSSSWRQDNDRHIMRAAAHLPLQYSEYANTGSRTSIPHSPRAREMRRHAACSPGLYGTQLRSGFQRACGICQAPRRA
jgi:hypothetical protein